jgi:hypothetical protein
MSGLDFYRDQEIRTGIYNAVQGVLNTYDLLIRGHSSVCKKLYAWARIYEGNWCYIRVHSTDAGQVLDLIKADPEAALHKLRRCRYFRLAA